MEKQLDKMKSDIIKAIENWKRVQKAFTKELTRIVIIEKKEKKEKIQNISSKHFKNFNTNIESLETGLNEIKVNLNAYEKHISNSK
jgi:hypothetical protein